MSQLDLEAVNPIAAQLGKIRAIPVTTSSVIFDLSASTEVWTDVQGGRMLRLRADGNDVYYAFNFTNTGTIDETNTTQGNATQCAVIPAGDYEDVRVPRVEGPAGGLCQYLLVKGAAACTLRLSVTSADPSRQYT